MTSSVSVARGLHHASMKNIPSIVLILLVTTASNAAQKQPLSVDNELFDQAFSKCFYYTGKTETQWGRGLKESPGQVYQHVSTGSSSAACLQAALDDRTKCTESLLRALQIQKSRPEYDPSNAFIEAHHCAVTAATRVPNAPDARPTRPRNAAT